jgi:hypothetical protein
MSDRKVGYCNPPEHSRFKKGVSANPKGRPKRQPPEVGEVIKGVMDASVEYHEAGRTRKATRRELSVRRHLKRALEGDIGAAAALLKLRAQAQGKRDASSLVVQISDLLPADASPTGEPHVSGSRGCDQTEMPARRKTSDADPTSEDP